MDMEQVRRRGPYAKSAERRAAIVEAAFEVFAERGFNSGSFQDVADRAGMSQTSLLHYFPNKSALLLAVLDRRDEIVDDIPDASQSLTDSILGRAHANVKIPGVIQLYTVLCGEATTAEHPGRDYFVTRFRNLRTEYAAELRTLPLREGVDPDRAAATIVALWDGIQLQWLLEPDAVDVELVLADYLHLILPTGVS
ncbi:TetR/AcrR family transcriptional regulator [Microbacteriaceae bacterium VKM Ac-2855]|nr:TetR/AcrR family transcriptional regulator [Microbacteriaceae bacterium VKM Ac-2855]